MRDSSLQCRKISQSTDNKLSTDNLLVITKIEVKDAIREIYLDAMKRDVAYGYQLPVNKLATEYNLPRVVSWNMMYWRHSLLLVMHRHSMGCASSVSQGPESLGVNQSRTPALHIIT
jgi:hypothetical protein